MSLVRKGLLTQRKFTDFDVLYTTNENVQLDVAWYRSIFLKKLQVNQILCKKSHSEKRVTFIP